MTAFAWVKGIHLVTVVCTLTLFLLRCLWAFRNSPNLRHPVMRWLPHVNDTILLSGALGSAWMLGQYPFVNSWLTAKVLALVAYIVLAHITLWRCHKNAQRAVFMTASLGVFVYIMLVARCHDPRVWICFGP